MGYGEGGKLHGRVIQLSPRWKEERRNLDNGLREREREAAKIELEREREQQMRGEDDFAATFVIPTTTHTSYIVGEPLGSLSPSATPHAVPPPPL